VVCRNTQLLSATMAHPPLSMLMPFKVLTPTSIFSTPLPAIRVRRVNQNFSIKTPILILRVLCSHLDTNIKLPSTQLLFLLNPNPTYGAL